jgi:hypothetical protein
VVSILHPTPLRAAIVGTFAVAMLLPGSLSAAAQTTSTGTLTGSVTCGADAITPAANAVVAPEGLDMHTQTNGVGQFTLYNVPAGQTLAIDVSDPLGSARTTRYNVVVPPGTTLDIGSLDLTICPMVGAPAPDSSAQGEQQQDQRGPAPY